MGALSGVNSNSFATLLFLFAISTTLFEFELQLLCCSSASVKMTLQHIDNKIYPNAVCNDGSSAGFYYHYTPSDSHSYSSANYWLIHLQGGNWCWSIDSCNHRYSTEPWLMSNKYWSQTVSKTGIFDANSTVNPLANAHKIFVPYCSSDGWMGYQHKSADSGGYSFMGQEIVSAVIHTLIYDFGMGNNISNNDILLLSGCSAGGRGAMANLDYLPIIIPVNIHFQSILGILDSAFWINVQPYDTNQVSFEYQTKHVYTFVNASQRVLNSKCGEIYYPDMNDDTNAWKCLFGEYKIPLLQLPHVINAAQYDSFQLNYDESNSQPTTYTPAMLNYAETPFRSTMRNGLLQNVSSDVLSAACWHHCVTEQIQFWNISVWSAQQSFSTVVRQFLINHNNNIDRDIDAMNNQNLNIIRNVNNKYIGNCTNGINCGHGCTAMTM